jgi:hypothetical protein
VSADESFDAALKKADDAERGGDDAKAAGILEGEAARVSSAAIAEAEKAPLETAWARAKRDALVAVMRERSQSLGPYAKALRGEDIDAKLAAVEVQVELQKKALRAASDALAVESSEPAAH